MRESRCVEAAREQRFLALLPYVRAALYARVKGRVGTEAREELQQAAAAWTWRSFLSLDAAGKRPEDWPWTFAARAVQAVLAGHRLYGKTVSRCPMSERRDTRQAARPGRSPMPDVLATGAGDDPALIVLARMDWTAFLRTLDRIPRRVAKSAVRGHSTAYIAGLLGLTPGRVSQIRRRVMEQFRDRA